MTKNVFWAQNAKYGHLGPDPPKIIILNFFPIISSVLPKRFGCALNHYQVIILSQVMNIFKPKYDEKRVLGPKCQIWSFGPRPPEINNFEILSYHQ